MLCHLKIALDALTLSVGLLFGTVLIFCVESARTSYEEVRHLHHDIRLHDSLQFNPYFQKTGVHLIRNFLVTLPAISICVEWRS